MSFDPDMTYWQSLRIVARGLIQNPIRCGEWEEFKEGVKNVLYYGLSQHYGKPIRKEQS